MTTASTAPASNNILNPENISRANVKVPRTFLGSPQFLSPRLSERLGIPVIVKVETANPLGCFKGRGTWMAISSIRENTTSTSVVVASSGNFGQGIAYAGRELGVDVTVVAPETANATKLNRILSLGANLVLVGRTVEEAIRASELHAEAHGQTLLVDGAEPWIAVGAGTIGLELTEAVARGDLPELGAVFVPVGAGALISGIGTCIRHASPSTQVIGVQAEMAPSAALSWRAGHPVATDTANSRADGIAGKTTLPEALAMFAPVVDDFALVSEEELEAEQNYLTRELGITVEAAAASGWAAIVARKPKDPIAFIVTGSNVPPAARA